MEHSATDDLAQARLGVLAAILEGDAGLAFDIVRGLMAEGVSFDTVLFDVVAPLQSDLGRRWQEGDVGIAEEHAATGAVETLIALLAGSLSQPDDGEHIVVACAEGDSHSLPARIVAAHLLYLGRRVTFLGTSVPATDLETYLAEMKPAALVLSCAMATRLPGARDCIRAAHVAGVPVVAGGRGFGDGTSARKLGADAWVPTPRHLDELLRTWDPRPDASEATAHDRTDEMRAVESADPKILAEAASTAGAILGDLVPAARLRADLRIFLDAVAATLLVGDAGVIDEYAAWHSHLHAPTHSGRESTHVLLTALHDALAAIAPTGAAYVNAAIDRLD